MFNILPWHIFYGFQENLEKEGLELEEDISGGDALNFLKIHAPVEVLRRYAEILKIRMPIRKCMDELLEAPAEISGAEGDNMLEFKLTQVSNIYSRIKYKAPQTFTNNSWNGR